MIYPSVLVTYVAIVVGFVFIPGPATLLTIARATSSGPRAGIATGVGIAAGDMFHTAMAVIGISAVIATSALFSLIKYAGAAYLIYLGIKAVFEKVPGGIAAAQPTVTISKAFSQGFFSEILNPKTALFFLAFLPQFVNPANGFATLQLSIFGFIFVLLGLVSTVVFALGAGKLGYLLRRNPAVLKWQGKVVGCIYCALGLRLAGIRPLGHQRQTKRPLK